MFPFEDEEDHEEWDEYGAALGPDEFQLKVNPRPGRVICAAPLTYKAHACLLIHLDTSNCHLAQPSCHVWHA